MFVTRVLAAIVVILPNWKMFWKVAMPLSIPSFVIVLLFEFQASWNNLQAGLIYLNAGSVSGFTAPLGIAYAMTNFLSRDVMRR